jgi:hypothetical protein
MCKRQIVAILLIIIGLGCNLRKSDWHLITVAGLETEKDKQFNNLLFLDNDVGIIAGDQRWVKRRNESEVDWNRNAIIYKTNNAAKNWFKVFESRDGYFSNITRQGDGILAVKIFQKQGATDSADVYQSIDSGNTWKLKFSFSNYVRQVKLFDSVWLIIAKDSLGNFSMFKSVDTAKTWQQIHNSHYPVYSCVFRDGYAYFLSSSLKKNVYFKNILVRLDYHNNELEIINLPGDVDGYVLSEENSDHTILLSGMKGNKIGLYKLDDNNGIQVTSIIEQSENYFPVKLFNYGNDMMLLAGRRDHQIIKYTIFHSYNNGKSWTIESLPRPSYASPSFFFYSEPTSTLKGWIFSGSNTFQHVLSTP